ncbi:Rrf2 family transcriptional regulator [Butyrivibrio sp. INlla16]|uniref:Rrf2 family transcriptional regulator n=1 Tax=Butyrivibrio sp. INlla16 TaxID=1520807 RepID=UPI00088DCC91|nr:Rrf2 family transcriptional regulator [Butyrivibrio sp. INlla16]SDB50237.1 Rrf2 family protein [Butyrivibrio sp. INlla16]
MQISSRFTMGVHILTCIEVFKDDHQLNSEFIASSVGANPVIIRKIFGQMKTAGLISVKRGGNGGVELARPVDEISLYDIYSAVESVEDEGLFHFHENPNANCEVGRNMHKSMDKRLNQIQAAMENEMKGMKLSDVIEDTKKEILLESK